MRTETRRERERRSIIARLNGLLAWLDGDMAESARLEELGARLRPAERNRGERCGGPRIINLGGGDYRARKEGK